MVKLRLGVSQASRRRARAGSVISSSGSRGAPATSKAGGLGGGRRGLRGAEPVTPRRERVVLRPPPVAVVVGGVWLCGRVVGCSDSRTLVLSPSYRAQIAPAPPSTAATAIAATIAVVLPRERRLALSGKRGGCGSGSRSRAASGERPSTSCARARSASSGSTSASSGLSGSTPRAYLSPETERRRSRTEPWAARPHRS